jgi:hypothetical protein
MPREPEWTAEMDADLDGPGSRFTPIPAIAIAVPEEEWGFEDSEIQDGAKEALARHFGDWIYDEQEELGKGQPESGSVGRGAAGLAAILTFIGLHAAGGVISVTAALAWKRFVEKAKGSLKGDDRHRLQVSRGAAAYLAVAEVAERFGEKGPLEIEAVEEPSSIAGRESTALSYGGLEPWVVLLHNRTDGKRYMVVIQSRGGDVLGAMETEMDEFEEMFLPPPEESEWMLPTRRKRK